MLGTSFRFVATKTEQRKIDTKFYLLACPGEGAWPALSSPLTSPPFTSHPLSPLLSPPLTSSHLFSPPLTSHQLSHLTSPHLTSQARTSSSEAGYSRAWIATLQHAPCMHDTLACTHLAYTTPCMQDTLHARHTLACTHSLPTRGTLPARGLAIAAARCSLHASAHHDALPIHVHRREGFRWREPEEAINALADFSNLPTGIKQVRSLPPLSLRSHSDLTPTPSHLPLLSLHSPSTLPPLSLLPLDAPTVANLLGSRSDLLGSRSNLLGSRSAAQAARSPLLARGGHPPTSAPVGAHPRGACGNRAPIRQCPRRPWRRRWGRRRWRWRWRLRWGLWRWRWRWRWRPGRSARRFVCL